MTIDHRQRADALLEVETTQGPREWILAAAVFALMLVEGVQDGGFWPGEALLVALVSLVVLGVGMVLVPPDRRSALLVASIMVLALWWLARAISAETVRNFLPLGAGMLGFAAAFVAVRPLVGRTRDVAALSLACLGGAAALVGFAGLVWRWYPMAIPAQGLWRSSTTLTYSDAAGLVLAVCLLVALGLDLCPPLARITVCLCAGGLLATQSRGAYVAFACACLLVPWRRYVRFALPLVAGAALGVAAIASSPDTGPVPWLAAAVVAATVVAGVASRDLGSSVRSSIRSTRVPTRSPAVVIVLVVAAAAVVVAVVVAAVVGVHHEIGLRALSPSDQDRAHEWSAALRQWRSAPLVGVGPDRPVTFHAADGTFAHFVHNEYLQIAADAGIVGLALLTFSSVAIVRVVRRVDVLSSCAVAALVCWAVAGGFDFDWHLSVVGLLGGCCVGLARGGTVHRRPNRARAQAQAQAQAPARS